jgi:chromosome segregation ATPase
MAISNESKELINSKIESLKQERTGIVESIKELKTRKEVLESQRDSISIRINDLEKDVK